MSEDELVEKWRSAKAMMGEADEKIRELEEFISKARESVKDTMQLEAERSMFSNFDSDLVDDFFKEPYVTIPKRPQEWYVIAPRFINFQIGWLEKSTASYNVFLVNKYMHWLAQIPSELREQFDFQPELPVKVYDGMVLTGKEHQEEVWSRYRKHLSQRVGKDRIRVKRGHEFHLIADMIDAGTLPFMPHPLAEEDIRSPPWREPVELRDYQEEAWTRFQETGALGVFWPFSAGKTYLGLYTCAHLHGPHLVVVPTRTLVEQWEERLNRHLGYSHGVQVVTYHAYEKIRNKEWKLAIFDECHRLPANTFSRMATIKADYRIGLSGTPYREDGRTDYIFALTGFPMGMDWHRLLEMEVFRKPDITLYVFDALRGKLTKLEELLRDPIKTIVFCDSIELGRRIAKKHDLPHVYGGTRKRLEVLKDALQVVVSRVGDEGISLPDIRRVIEVDFLYGSRRQEAQRMGRLFHGKGVGEHI
ncbi:MAG: DEAD/DEAH box helicase family protein, partial [Thermoplasmata archaeon]